MIDKIGNIWDYYRDYPESWVVVTTNGFVKPNGECVMGRGIAREAKTRFSRLPMKLGSEIERHGNHVYQFVEYRVFSFPTKHVWWDASDVQLIKRSTEELMEWVGNGVQVFMPRPGCGNGRLKWDDVRPIIQVLPDNFTVMSRGVE